MAAERFRYVSDCDENTSFSESESNSEASSSRKRKCRLPTANDGRRKSVTTLDKRILTSNNGRKSKCFSRNALLARENRLKKKLYIMNLESEVNTIKEKNKKLSGLVENQLLLIQDLKKEVKYLKSVLANSTDISNLVRNINCNTGMSVRSSLDNKLSLNNCVSKPRLSAVGRKTAHPFEEPEHVNTEESSLPVMTEWNSPPLLDDFEGILMNDASLGAFDFDLSHDELSSEDTPKVNHEIPLEHNYTCLSKDANPEDDVGVCLHVSKHRVSLEFCPTCSDRAHHNWDN